MQVRVTRYYDSILLARWTTAASVDNLVHQLAILISPKLRQLRNKLCVIKKLACAAQHRKTAMRILRRWLHFARRHRIVRAEFVRPKQFVGESKIILPKNVRPPCTAFASRATR